MPEQEQSSEVIQLNPSGSWWIQTSAEEHWMLYYHAIIKRHFLNDLVISATHNPSPRSLFCLNLNPISRVSSGKYYSEKILNKLFTSWWNFSSLSYFQIFILSFAYDFSSSSSSCHYISLFYWFVFHIFFNRLLRQSLPLWPWPWSQAQGIGQRTLTQFTFRCCVEPCSVLLFYLNKYYNSEVIVCLFSSYSSTSTPVPNSVYCLYSINSNSSIYRGVEGRAKQHCVLRNALWNCTWTPGSLVFCVFNHLTVVAVVDSSLVWWLTN